MNLEAKNSEQAPGSDPPQASGSNRVGYGSPPAATRFQKGQSGNPRGRPKGSLNVTTVLAASLREKVIINENGQRKVVTKLQAALKQLTNKAASGDLRAVMQLIELAQEAEQKETVPASQRSDMGELDQKVMHSILKRFQSCGQTPGADNES
jgi:hypothetical protein